MKYLKSVGLITACWMLLGPAAVAADFTVTSPGFFYNINGVEPNPVLTLVRGKTYTFLVNTDPGHPFLINGAGVVNNNTNFGTITYTVPNNTNNHRYFCSIHGFGAQIITVDGTSVPVVQIVSLSVGTNILLRSTGTNTWTVNPEYVTNLSSGNWSPLIVQSNRFLNGTNETFCGRPPGDELYIRVRSQPQ